MPHFPEWLDLRTVAHLLHLDERTARRHLDEAGVPTVRRGRRVLRQTSRVRLAAILAAPGSPFRRALDAGRRRHDRSGAR